jgi:hypothetical protein
MIVTVRLEWRKSENGFMDELWIGPQLFGYCWPNTQGSWRWGIFHHNGRRVCDVPSESEARSALLEAVKKALKGES